MGNDALKILVDQVVDARARGNKLNIVGSGSKDFLGREPQGEIITVSQHNGIVSLQPEELVLTVRGGTLVSEIQAALKEYNLALSFEPPTFDDKATIGGTLACHLSGPARPWKGSVRDMVLGVRLINGEGRELNFGGKVIKNVAGYDVSRLQAGAMGTLGIITEISFKILPRADADLTLVEELSADEAIEKMNRTAGLPNPLSAACWMDDKLYLRLSGTTSVIEKAADSLKGEVLEQGGHFWEKLREQQMSFFESAFRLYRFSVKPSARHVLKDSDWLLDWGGAQRWLRLDENNSIDLSELEAFAEEMGGQVSVYRGGKRTEEVFHKQPPGMQSLFCRVKKAFDPDALFNPGRLYSWL